ncbi:MAG: hypothetical protein ABS81_03780 [Pseudonocardia sp. SCN 72-86]|uniref:hypothetical protein n=1 Tax=uncultured Microbacterium sp. TaxID=191216 RepID=UPI00086E50C1|nr:hypothetical protein [uncultured Microbacterium sp.]ODU06743.1 MAG: hypothetical protein ABS81_03780 [Pseudonocardia sp. SCN 72-86]
MSTTTPTQTGLLEALRTEWSGSLTDREHDFAGIGIRSCSELELELKAAAGREQDRLLHALLTAGHDGDALAERVALQHMLPKAVHLARTCRGLRALTLSDHTPVDAVSTAIGAMWESIRRYPLNRVEKVKANIGMDALLIVNKSMSPGDPSEHVTEDVYLEQALQEQGKSATIEPEWGDDTFHDLVTVLTWAIDTEALTPEDVRLLARFDLGELHERDELAEDLGIGRASLTRRVYRIRVKLMEAVQAHIRENGTWE